MQIKLKTERSILVVEDDQITRNALVYLLKRLGYRVDAAGTVADGLAQLNGQHFAILDLNLSDGIGTTILDRIRSEKRPIRVAVASGTEDDRLWGNAAKYKPDLLLRKPLNVNEILAWLGTANQSLTLTSLPDN